MSALLEPLQRTRAVGPSAWPQRLYLELLARVLTGMVNEDPNFDRWSPRIFNAERRALGRDWPMRAQSMIGFKRMENLAGLLENCIVNDVPGDFIETGVWRGGACIMARAVFKAFGVEDRTVWVADSFEGLPAPDKQYASDYGDPHHRYTELIVSIDEVKKNFEKYGMLDGQVRFLKGWFNDTLPMAPIEKLCVLRLDGDMYGSTWEALTALYDKVSVGGFVIVDDWAIPGCQQAVKDFRHVRGLEVDEIRDIDGFGVYWQKTKQEAAQ